ncbi:MAG: HlyD family efflux transporter periplasmic adaptor subunit [Proteobacteria bacterium]|nr:HlyD family efflux transporter periplasmic adaptor subunit [Pseudomonadota bacterium]
MTTEPATPAAPPAASATRRRLLLAVALVVGVAATAIGLYQLLVGRYHVDTDDATVAGDIVNVTPQVAGMVSRIRVEDTQAVKAGDVLIELDATDQRVARARAEAELARAVRDVEALYETTDALAAQAAANHAQAAAAEAERARAASDLERRRAIAAEGGVSQEELLHATEQLRAADAQLAAARGLALAADRQLAANRAQTSGTTLATHPRVLAAAAAVREAVIAEGRTRILAPVDGQVAKRAVSLGTLVTPGTPLLSIVPLGRVWVDANFKEAQLADVRSGQSATLSADLYGRRVEYHGRVVGLAAGTGSAFALLPAQNATGNWIKVVQRVPVRVELDPAEVAGHPLRVGLSMTVDVDTRGGRDGRPLAAIVAPAVGATGVYEDLERLAETRIAQIIGERGRLPGPERVSAR